MIYKIIALVLFLCFEGGCGVKGAPMPRKDEIFIRPSTVRAPEKATGVAQEKKKSEKLIRKKEKR